MFKEALVKNTLWLVFAVACAFTFAGCDDAGNNGGTTAPAPSAEVRTRDGNVDVNVGPPGEKPGVDVDVRPGGNVDVDIDGEKIRQRVQERREERREELQQESERP